MISGEQLLFETYNATGPARAPLDSAQVAAALRRVGATLRRVAERARTTR